MYKVLTLIFILISTKAFCQKSNLNNKSKFNPYDFCEYIEEGSCNPKVEKALINYYPKIIKRTDEHTLTLKLGNGKNKVLKDVIKNDEVIAYFRALNYLQQIKMLVIYVQYNERSEYLLIDQTNGNSFHTIGMPIVSPDNKNIICINLDLEAEYNPNGLQIWNYNKGILRKVYESIVKNWGPKSATWLSNTKINIERETFDSNTYKTATTSPITLSYTSGKWIKH